MASWQDIRALEELIYEEVEEYLNNIESYYKPALRVYFDDNKMRYLASAEDRLQYSEDNGIYPMQDLVRIGDDNKLEPDIDKISDIANSWIFLD